MSTILEALKKSEQERKLNKLPTLSDMPVPEEQSNWPLRALIVLLVLMLGLLLWWLFGWFNLSDESNSGAPDSKQIILSNDSIEASRMLDGQLSESAESKVDPALANEIVVNVVSYSEQAEQRFVMINGKLYREGEFVRAGLKVELIKPDSVILNHRGKRVERKP